MTPEDSPEALHNVERITAFFNLNVHVPVTVQSIVAAVEQMRNQMKFKSAIQQAFDKIAAQLLDQGRDLLSWIPRQRTFASFDPGNIYSSKPSDNRTYYLSGTGDELLENFNIIAGWLIRNGYPVTHDGFQFGLTNVLKSKDSQNLRWIMEARKKPEPFEESKEQASVDAQNAKELLHPDLRLSEKAKAHKEMLERQPKKIQIGAPAPEYSYWKGRCESAIAALPVMDRAEAQQIMDRQKGGSYETAHTFIMTYTQKRAQERAYAQSLARMGR